jgi:molybdenum cofactor cytidylyltransferase
VPVAPSLAFPTVAAVLLAAGSSRRYGPDNKLLADIDGTPLLARAAAALVHARLAEIVVVTGHEADLIEQALACFGANLRFVHNPKHSEGMGGSVAAGIKALTGDIDGTLVVQGDMPDLNTALICQLSRHFIEAGRDRIIVPWIANAGDHGGRQGNPVIWPRRLFPALMALTGDQGGKALIQAAGNAVERVIVADTSAATDIDTREQLAAYRRIRG